MSTHKQQQSEAATLHEFAASWTGACECKSTMRTHIGDAMRGVTSEANSHTHSPRGSYREVKDPTVFV